MITYNDIYEAQKNLSGSLEFPSFDHAWAGELAVSTANFFCSREAISLSHHSTEIAQRFGGLIK